MPQITVPKIKLPKIDIRSIDWSRWNLRKFNWITVLGVLSYLNVLVVIPALFGKKSPFVQFHVRQGMILLAVWAVFLFSFHIILVPWIFALFILFAIIIGILNVSTGRERHLPIVGKLLG